MKKVLDFALSIVYILYFGLIICVFHVIQVICFKFVSKRAHQVSVNYLNASMLYGWILTGSTGKFIKKHEIPENKSIIFIANHQGMFDIPGIIWFLRKYTPLFVSKIELAHGIPSISYNLRVGGAALIDRKDGKQAILEIARLGKYIKETGFSVAIFPEGTRSRDGKLKDFAIGGVATILKKCPEAILVPVAIKNTGRFTPKGIFPMTSFTNMSWTTLEPIDPKKQTIEEALQNAKGQIQQELDRL